MTPSCCNVPRSSLTAQCSVSLPSSTRNQCDCRATDPPPSGRDTHELPFVRADHRAQHSDRLAISGDVLDLEVVVGEDRKDPLPDVPGAAVTVLVGAGGVVDVGSGETRPSMASRSCLFQTSST